MDSAALVVTRHGERDVLAVEPFDPGDPGPGEVLVEVAYAGVNFIDVYKRQGIYPGNTPFVLGEEGSGTVLALGPDVQGLAVGDQVAWCQHAGSMASQALKPASALVTVPNGIGLDVAAAVMLQGLTAHYLVQSTYHVEPDDTVLIHAAAGGVGQLLVQMCKTIGATVVATAGTNEKLDIARKLGADHTINYSTHADAAGLASAVRDAAGGGVQVVYDGVGKATFEASLQSLAPRGYMVLFGGASGQVPPFDIQTLNRMGSLFLTRPSLGAYVATRTEYEWRANAVLSAVAKGELHVDIGGVYPLAEAAAAYEALEGRATTGKLIIDIRA